MPAFFAYLDSSTHLADELILHDRGNGNLGTASGQGIGDARRFNLLTSVTNRNENALGHFQCS